MRVSLFIPCLIDQFHPQIGRNVVQILRKIGAKVEYTNDQVCCGQPFFKTGYWKKTIPLAKKTILAFRNDKIVVAPSGSCVNMIRNHYLELFQEDPIWLERAEAFSQKIYEFSEFLIHIAQVKDLGASCKAKGTYHDSCQVSRGLGISSEPRQLLRHIKGLELIEMKDSDRCCGFGGVFSFRFPHIAKAMVEEKVKNIISSGAEAVVGCEMSCLMHIGGYLRYKAIPIRTLHLSDLLVLK